MPSAPPASVRVLSQEVPESEHIAEAAAEERRTSYLELFFDLVFVFAITQVTALLLGDTSPEGYARSLLVLVMVWWAWSAYAWMTNAIDVDTTLVRVALVAAAGASFLMALGLPDAYHDDAAWFALPYFAVRVVHVGLYVYGLRDDPEHQAAVRALAPFFLVSPALVLAGGFLDDPARVALWCAAMAVDVLGTFWVNRGGQVFRVSPSHFAERYGLFVIIALGESIVAVGLGATGLERDAAFAASVAVAFAGVAVLWWAYFDFTAGAAERALRRTPPAARGPLARDLFTLFHFPIVAGIILFAVAAKKTVGHAGEPLSDGSRFALGAGIALYLLGFALARYRAAKLIAWERLAGAAAALVLAGVLDQADAIVLMTIVIAVLAASVAVETVRMRDVRAAVRSG